MDGSHFPIDPEKLIDSCINEIITEDLTDEQEAEFLEILSRYEGCECGCRGRNHTRLSYLILGELTQLRIALQR